MRGNQGGGGVRFRGLEIYHHRPCRIEISPRTGPPYLPQTDGLLRTHAASPLRAVNGLPHAQTITTQRTGRGMHSSPKQARSLGRAPRQEAQASAAESATMNRSLGDILPPLDWPIWSGPFLVLLKRPLTKPPRSQTGPDLRRRFGRLRSCPQNELYSTQLAKRLVKLPASERENLHRCTM